MCPYLLITPPPPSSTRSRKIIMTSSNNLNNLEDLSVDYKSDLRAVEQCDYSVSDYVHAPLLHKKRTPPKAVMSD